MDLYFESMNHKYTALHKVEFLAIAVLAILGAISIVKSAYELGRDDKEREIRYKLKKGKEI